MPGFQSRIACTTVEGVEAGAGRDGIGPCKCCRCSGSTNGSREALAAALPHQAGQVVLCGIVIGVCGMLGGPGEGACIRLVRIVSVLAWP